ncbi:MAG TPA: histidine kinase [Chitinophaga sp.]|nr:histidine kinase [Chitinophaga sp.]
MNWRNTAIEAAEHKVKAAQNKQAAMEAELQALKLQIDPHFVFNNLSVLSELILEDQQLGYEYAENFSKVYRYLLINSKKDIILLEEELKFLNAYIFLIRHRAGNGVHFEIDVDKGSRELYLPPLTLQLLIENALKHNKTIKSDPLKIRIFSNDKKELIVENKLIAIEKQVSSSGIGLQNIISRYELLSKEPPEIIKGADSFKVIIRLIKL